MATGYRECTWETRRTGQGRGLKAHGTVEPRIPKLCKGSDVPGFLEPSRMADKALCLDRGRRRYNREGQKLESGAFCARLSISSGAFLAVAVACNERPLRVEPPRSGRGREGLESAPFLSLILRRSPW
jgi:hypothetical protein